MKPHPAGKGRVKLPKARVMYTDEQGYSIPSMYPTVIFGARPMRYVRTLPVVVTPCRTLKQARALAKVANMSREKLIHDVRNAICEGLLGKGGIPAMGSVHTYDAMAESVLNALGYTHE